MTIKQCYQAMGADFEEISQRIPSEAMIRKFAVKFPEDKSFDASLTRCNHVHLESHRVGVLQHLDIIYNQDVLIQISRSPSS